MSETESVSSVDRWLLNNPQYIRSVSRASGAGGLRISLPKQRCESAGVDDDDRLVVLPSDLAGQLGMHQDPLFEIYLMPGEGEL